jgi:hypothetical protein
VRDLRFRLFKRNRALDISEEMAKKPRGAAIAPQLSPAARILIDGVRAASGRRARDPDVRRDRGSAYAASVDESGYRG